MPLYHLAFHCRSVTNWSYNFVVDELIATWKIDSDSYSYNWYKKHINKMRNGMIIRIL